LTAKLRRLIKQIYQTKAGPNTMKIWRKFYLQICHCIFL